MTSVIFEEFLTSFNRKMRLEGRKVLLFLDNATCHPNKSLSHVELVFFPPNTTAFCQPMDQGVIQSFKLQYRKLLMQHIVSHIDECIDLSGMDPKKLPDITVLDAVNWTSIAWDRVRPDSITKCFQRCGFVGATESGHDDTEVIDALGFDNFLSEEASAAFINFDNAVGGFFSLEF